MRTQRWNAPSMQSPGGKLALCFLTTMLLAAADKPVFAADTSGAGGSGRTVDVLMIGHYGPRPGEASWLKYQAACAREGIRVFINEKGSALDYEQFTDDYLRQFHVVVFGGLPDQPVNPSADDMKAMAAFRERLEAYYQAGGGVLWVPEAFQEEGTYWNKVVGARYDAQSLEEDLYDPGKTLDINPMLRKGKLLKYIWTTNLAEHPVTKNVKGLFLPLTGEWSWPGTVPMKFGKSWTVLVKGMESTRTMGNAEPFGSGKCDFRPEVKGSYESSPEIVGVREAQGKSGRMMVFPFHGTHTYLNFGHEAFNDAMMINGYGGQASKAHRLLLNAYKWLAEPAVTAGFGGYKPVPPITAAIPTPIDWSKAEFPPNSWGGARTFWNQNKQGDTPMTDLLTPTGKDFRGLLGARTGASDGQGSVADYVKVAQGLGLSFVVFLEKLENLDEARYGKLVADCAAASTESFAALPGYLFRDQTGLLYYFYGANKLPLADNLTEDRRVKVPYNLVDQFSWAGILGLAELGQLKINPNYLFLLTCTAPYVYEGGKLVDDGLANYLSIEGHGHQYAPTALVQVTSPAEMEAAVKGEARLTVVHAETLTAGLKAMTRESPRHPTPAYTTNGPTITRWGALNPIGHPFFAGKQRVRFALEAASDAGLAEVTILNANTGAIFRHFRPHGAKTFSCFIDETHQRQWSLVPIVTDVNGRSALAGTLQTYQDGNRIWMMSDRLMGMNHVLGWDVTRRRLVMEGGWLGGIPWTKNWAYYAGGAPSNLAKSRGSGGMITGTVVGIDGGFASSGGTAALYFEPSVVTDQGTEPKMQAYRFEDRLASFDVAVMDHDGSDQFASNKRTEWKQGGWPPNPDPQIPMEMADIQARTIAVRPSPEATVSANLHEIVVTFKKDVLFKRIPLFVTAWQSNNPVYLALRDGEGDLSWLLPPKAPFSRNGTLPPGGYLFPGDVWGGRPGVINLGPQPLDYEFGNPSGRVFVNGAGRRAKADETIRARFITFVSPQGEVNASNQWLRKFIADFGIGADRPGYPFTVRQGKLRSTNYLMELQPENGGATVEFGKHNLAHNLLVAVDGFAANAVTGRYDLERRQLLILPVFEGKAITSVNLARGDARLYLGELFHCDNQEVRLSCVQEGVDKVLLELHNPTDKALTAKLKAVSGFAPLAGLDKTLTVPPCASVKLELPTAAGSLVNEPYKGD